VTAKSITINSSIKVFTTAYHEEQEQRKEGAWEMSPAEIILREARKLPWYEWQRIVKAMEFVHRKRADKLTLDDSEDTHEELMFHVEYY
jgi:hypothetical protein